MARNHLHDWVVLILLAAVVIALHFAPPFSRFVGKDMMTYVSYPVKQSTVPAWGVPVCIRTSAFPFPYTNSIHTFIADIGYPVLLADNFHSLPCNYLSIRLYR